MECAYAASVGAARVAGKDDLQASALGRVADADPAEHGDPLQQRVGDHRNEGDHIHPIAQDMP